MNETASEYCSLYASHFEATPPTLLITPPLDLGLKLSSNDPLQYPPLGTWVWGRRPSPTPQWIDGTEKIEYDDLESVGGVRQCTSR